jgi:hypothetical protein
MTGKMTRRGEIHLGDLARALHHFPNATPEEREWVASCLGFEIRPQTLQQPTLPHYRPTQSAVIPRFQAKKAYTGKSPALSPPAAMPPVPETFSQEAGDILPTAMEVKKIHLEPSQSAEPALDLATPLALNSSLPPRDRKTLFSRRTARGILGAAVMQPTAGRNIDIPKLVRAIGRRDPLAKVPYLPRYTAQNGCQLLLDFSDALMAWWEDMHALIRQFRQLLSEEQCPLYEFDHTPSAAVRWTENDEIPWQPVYGKPVIVASDLGVIQPARASARANKSNWIDFIKQCRHNRSQVIVLFPLDPRRCPSGLDRMASIIPWQPSTTSASVKRFLSAHIKTLSR